MLAWTLAALRDNGVRDVRLVAGWQAEKLREWSPDVVVNEHWSSTGVVRSLLLAAAWLRQAPSLVVYGDGVSGRAALRRVFQASAEERRGGAGRVMWGMT